MSIQSYMADDLASLYEYDMPAQAKIGAKTFTVLIDDLLNEEIEAYGGAEAIATQRIHFLTVDKPSIIIGSPVSIRQKDGKKFESKIVMSSITSADGNELIVTVRGA
jgi:hypothetical protein